MLKNDHSSRPAKRSVVQRSKTLSRGLLFLAMGGLLVLNYQNCGNPSGMDVSSSESTPNIELPNGPEMRASSILFTPAQIQAQSKNGLSGSLTSSGPGQPFVTRLNDQFLFYSGPQPSNPYQAPALMRSYTQNYMFRAELQTAFSISWNDTSPKAGTVSLSSTIPYIDAINPNGPYAGTNLNFPISSLFGFQGYLGMSPAKCSIPSTDYAGNPFSGGKSGSFTFYPPACAFSNFFSMVLTGGDNIPITFNFYPLRAEPPPGVSSLNIGFAPRQEFITQVSNLDMLNNKVTGYACNPGFDQEPLCYMTTPSNVVINNMADFMKYFATIPSTNSGASTVQLTCLKADPTKPIAVPAGCNLKAMYDYTGSIMNTINAGQNITFLKLSLGIPPDGQVGRAALDNSNVATHTIIDVALPSQLVPTVTPTDSSTFGYSNIDFVKNTVDAYACTPGVQQEIIGVVIADKAYSTIDAMTGVLSQMNTFDLHNHFKFVYLDNVGPALSNTGALARCRLATMNQGVPETLLVAHAKDFPQGGYAHVVRLGPASACSVTNVCGRGQYEHFIGALGTPNTVIGRFTALIGGPTLIPTITGSIASSPQKAGTAATLAFENAALTTLQAKLTVSSKAVSDAQIAQTAAQDAVNQLKTAIQATAVAINMGPARMIPIDKNNVANATYNVTQDQISITQLTNTMTVPSASNSCARNPVCVASYKPYLVQAQAKLAADQAILAAAQAKLTADSAPPTALINQMSTQQMSLLKALDAVDIANANYVRAATSNTAQAQITALQTAMTFAQANAKAAGN